MPEEKIVSRYWVGPDHKKDLRPEGGSGERSEQKLKEPVVKPEMMD